MKKTLLTTFFYAVIYGSIAQVIKPVKEDAAFSKVLSTVVLDYKNNFINIQRKELAGSIANNTFNSNVCLPAALHCTITRYTSVQDKSASWQSILYTGESYEDALKMYKTVFGQVKHSSISGIDTKLVYFEGEMEIPDENIRFTVSELHLVTTNKIYKKFTAAIELTNNLEGWEVHLNLYRKKLDTEGNTTE